MKNKNKGVFPSQVGTGWCWVDGCSLERVPESMLMEELLVLVSQVQTC